MMDEVPDNRWRPRAPVFFGLAALGFIALFVFLPPDSTPRPLWPAAFLLILSSIGMIGAGFGALVEHPWIGFTLAFALPIALFVAFVGFGALC